MLTLFPKDTDLKSDREVLHSDQLHLIHSLEGNKRISKILGENPELFKNCNFDKRTSLFDNMFWQRGELF